MDVAKEVMYLKIKRSRAKKKNKWISIKGNGEKCPIKFKKSRR